MGKILTAVIALVAILGAAWSGFWFYGKGKIVEEIEAQAQIIRDRGGEATYDSIDVAGFPFSYEGRIVSPKVTMTQDSLEGEAADIPVLGYTWSAPWIEAEATVTAPNIVEFTIADAQDIVIDLPEEEGGPLPISLTSSDLKVVSERGDGEFLFRANATSMGGTFSRESEKAGMADIAYNIRDLVLSGRVKDDRSTGDRPPMAFDYTLAGIDGTAEMAGTEENPGGTIAFGSGSITGGGDALGDETTGSATFENLKMSFQFVQLGETPVDLGIGKVTARTRIPNAAAANPQPFGYRISIENITMADLLWTMMDPAQAYPRELNELVVDVDGTAVFTASPSNAEAFAEAMKSGLPIDVRTLQFNDLTVDALGLVAKGTGGGSLENDVPQGTATIGIDGFSGFMESMVKSGRMPPQQAMVVQLMVENFGKMSEDGKTVRFDFEARDGMMYVNSLPIGEAPTMPQ